MEQRIGIIFNGGWSMYALAQAPKYKAIYRLIYAHSITWEKLADLDAIVVPFLSNHKAIADKKELIYRFLAAGKKVFVEGDSSELWIDAKWEDRPVNNYWWVENPNNPPISETDYSHPVYTNLVPRHACWHTHGVYTQIPISASIVQKNSAGEIVTWQTEEYGGVLFATTLDPFIEHGIQQITHLDNYVDSLTEWLCGIRPVNEKLTFQAADYGVEADLISL